MGEVSFARSFWGEKNTGFDVLTQNLKAELKNTNDFYEFLRELNSMDDYCGKVYVKLSKQISNYAAVGSFKPCWSVIGGIIDQITSFNSELCSDRFNLMKEIQKYTDELQKKQRQLKEAEAATQEVVHSFQLASAQLQKAKDLYHTRYSELERVRSNETCSLKDREKSENKLKKAQDDYKYSVEKYNNLRSQFVDKMNVSCAHFQVAEYDHLQRMCQFLQRYSSSWDRVQGGMSILVNEFKSQQIANLPPDSLLALFVGERSTGVQEPAVAAFEDVEVAAAFTPASDSPSIHTASPTLSPGCVFTNGGTNRQQTCVRAASALAAVGDAGNLHGSLVDVMVGPRSGVNDSDSPTWMSSIGEINSAASSSTVRRKRREGLSLSNSGGGSFFSRRNRQNSFGNEPCLDASPAIATISSSGGSNWALKWPNVRSRPRIAQKLANSPTSSSDTKVEPGWTTNSVTTDEEGYTLRPANPWGSLDIKPQSSSGSEDSDTDGNDRSFKGIKVNIRPAGELAPGVADVAKVGIVLAAPQITRKVGRANSTQEDVLRHRNVSPLEFYASTIRPHTSAGRPLTKTGLVAAVTAASSSYPFHPLATTSATELPLVVVTRTDLTDVSSVPSITYSSTWARSRRRLPTSMSNTVVGMSSTFSSQGTQSVDFSENGKNSHTDSDDSCPTLAQNTPQPMDSESTSKYQDVVGEFVPWSANGRDQSLASGKNSPNPGWQAFFPTASDDVAEKTERNPSATLIPELATSLSPVLALSSTTIRESSSSFLPETTEFNAAATESQSPSKLNLRQMMPLPQPPPLPPLVAPKPLTTASNTLGRLDPFTPTSSLLFSLPIAIALTETWRAHFPNGGGSSLSMATAARQHLLGQLTLAVRGDDLRRLGELQKTSGLPVQPLVLVFHNCQCMRKLEAGFAGIQISGGGGGGGGSLDSLAIDQTSPSSSSTTYTVTLPGDTLHSALWEAHSRSSPDSEYTRLNLINYSIDLAGIRPPITLCTFWRCEPTTTDFRLDYSIQWPKGSVDSIQQEARSQDLRVTLLVDGDVTNMESHPTGNLEAGNCRASWTVPISASSSSATTSGVESGLIRAKFSLARGPGRPQPVALQFCRDGGALPSGVTVSLHSDGYRLTLCKYRLMGDHYVCDPPLPTTGAVSSFPPPPLPPQSSR